MWEALPIVSNWNPALVMAVFLVLPAVSWWVFQTAYQNHWIEDREGFRWSLAFRRLRTASAVCLSLGSVIVAVLVASFIIDVFQAASETVLWLPMFFALVAVGFSAAHWAICLQESAVHSRRPGDYTVEDRAMGVTRPSRPYDKEKAVINLVGVCLATVVALATVLVIVAGVVAIIGGILGALGIFFALPPGLVASWTSVFLMVLFFVIIPIAMF